MKTFWKALGIAALAAVIPIRFKKDEETGAKTFQSLLWKLDISPKEGDNVEIGLDLMEGILTGPLMNAIDAKKEAELFTDDPEEAVLFADEVQAAAEEIEAAAEVQAAAKEVEAAAEEIEAAAEVQAAVKEVEAAAEEIEAAAEEIQTDAEKAQAAAGEDDFDPYFF